MGFLRTTILTFASTLSILYVIGYVSAVLPLRCCWEFDGFHFLGYPHVTAFTPFDVKHHAWGPRSWSLFQVADFPTGEARVVFAFPSWFGTLPAVGILIFAAFTICHKHKKRVREM